MNEWRYRFRYSDPVIKLILVNAVVFIFCVVFNLFAWMFKGDVWAEGLRNFLSLPASWSALLTKPWTLVTYQFTHFKLFHILFNMLVLNMAGTIFMDFFKKKEVWRVYILGGVVAAFLFILSTQFLPVFEGRTDFYLIGASASVMAILFAATTYAPHIRLTLFGVIEIKLIWFALFFLLIDLVSIPESNAGGHIAHIGGVIFGWLYAWYRKNNYAYTFFEKKPKVSAKKTHLKVEINQQSTRHSGVQSKDKSNRMPTQEEIDAILDKISKSGYDRLSKEEKDILFKASQE